ncbi:cation diffusion facilitator family transporter [Guptibacillus hwajinpoensis]|uniref:cation diffusion facilitator family transporter n=1 Tax=Guptibacillus hwajinpoensis TaxID=208199 RepID=UPI001CFF509C|nr:cation diffusion facilitator family transporter [Pseudalkalibacillus hwajinpoensis]WLR59214.1 cation diffusion facilitator family transporter [Pseudalkalibacillus hwajinpoensis]
MGHNHSHDHGHTHSANKKALLISFILIFTFMILEVVGGIITNSLALLSDAGHMLSDAVALGMSLLAFKLGEKKSDTEKTYGYKRFEILAAFLNGIALIAISFYILWESINRFIDPPDVASTGMLVIAAIGLIVNILVAWILMKGDTSENLNLRSAFLHVLGDLLGSIGAIIAALLIMFIGWNYADPIASAIVAILVLISGIRVTKDSFHVLMEGTPSNIDLQKVKEALVEIEGVNSIHDLHIWNITSDFPSFTCHLVVNQGVNRDQMLKIAGQKLHDQFELTHTTIQIECETSELKDQEDNCNE